MRAALLTGVCGVLAACRASPQPAAPVRAEWAEFCAALDALGPPSEPRRQSDWIAAEFAPAAGTQAREWPGRNGWGAWGIELDAPRGSRLRLGLRELREDAFHAHAQLHTDAVERFVVLLPVHSWDRFVLLREHAGKWSVECDEAIAAEPRFVGFDELREPALLGGGWLERARGWWVGARVGAFGPRVENFLVHSASGGDTAAVALDLDSERQGDFVLSMHTISDRRFTDHPLEDWPAPVWALSLELRSPWPEQAAESGEANVWELADLLEGWTLPDEAGAAGNIRAHGLRAPTDPAPRDWPRKHGWLACGVRLCADDKDALLLAFRDARHDGILLCQRAEPEETISLVLLVRVPDLERCAFLRGSEGHWRLVTCREIPEAARAGGFGALAIPQLRQGGWVESGIETIAGLRARVGSRVSRNLWLWSGNGAGTESIAAQKDARQRGEPAPGQSLVGPGTAVDPSFLREPLADWPWPVWTLTVDSWPGAPR